MAKVKFLSTMKINHKFYPAHQVIEVPDFEYDELMRLGAVGVEPPKDRVPAEPKTLAKAAPKVAKTAASASVAQDDGAKQESKKKSSKK